MVCHFWMFFEHRVTRRMGMRLLASMMVMAMMKVMMMVVVRVMTTAMMFVCQM
jgi:hypothetical protein